MISTTSSVQNKLGFNLNLSLGKSPREIIIFETQKNLTVELYPMNTLVTLFTLVY